MPFHKHRTWVVRPAESIEWLAERLVNHSWCNCAGWSLGDYLFLNDQTNADGAFEVAVVQPSAEPDGPWGRSRVSPSAGSGTRGGARPGSRPAS